MEQTVNNNNNQNNQPSPPLPSAAKIKRGSNFSKEEDEALVEGLRLHGRKIPKIKEYMETACKMTRSEEEIANRVKNVLKSTSLYLKPYSRKPFVRPKHVTDQKEIFSLNEKWIDLENLNEQIHDRIRKKVTEIRKKDSTGKSSDSGPGTEDDVHSELVSKGQERKQIKNERWGDLKGFMESDKKQKESLLQEMGSIKEEMKKTREMEEVLISAITDYLKAKKARLEEPKTL